MSSEKTYTDAEIASRIARHLPRWEHHLGYLRRTYHTGGWKGTLMVVNAIGHLAELAWHHPDLRVSYDTVTVTLMTHSAKGITDKDFELARKIEETIQWRPGPDSALTGIPNDPRFEYVRND